ILQVSDRKTDHYKKELGYPIEFIPLSNPYSVEIGNELSFQLLKNGKPVKNQIVYYSNYTSEDNQSHSEDNQSHSHEEKFVRTDDSGEFALEINHEGVWLIRAINMVESKEQNVDYESNWATLTFKVNAR